MLKWVRERFSGLATQRDRRVGPSGSEIGNHEVVGAVALAVTRHVTAISSTLFATENTRVVSAAHSRFSGTSVLGRRPGVHARWKEKNRLPMQTLS